MRVGGLVAGCLVVLACATSGQRSGSPREQAAGAPGAMSGAGGEGLAGESSASGCAGYATTSGCIDSCFTDQPLAVKAVCEDGTWRCPPESTPFSECPPESCYGLRSKCCHALTGAEATRACGSDGMLEACPADFDAIERGALCAPESVAPPSCDVLEGTACEDAEYRCSQGGGCGKLECACRAGTDGALRWECYARLC